MQQSVPRRACFHRECVRSFRTTTKYTSSPTFDMSNGTESRGASHSDSPQPTDPAHFLQSRRKVLEEGSSGLSTSTTAPSASTHLLFHHGHQNRRHALTRWLLDLRLEYEEAIRTRCKTTSEDVAAIIVSVRVFVEESLLDTMCEIKWERAKVDLPVELDHRNCRELQELIPFLMSMSY